ncbi:MAG: enoyl-CoA hydratase-related protein [Bdellovibrionota bacterium]
MAAYEDIKVESENGIRWIAINRPTKLNCFRNQTIDELTDAFREAGRDASVGAIVLSGEGGKSFCAGGDIEEMSAMNAQSGRVFLQRLMGLARAIREAPQPVIAMVDGYCLGGGHELHMICDLTIASSRSKFGQTGPRVGSVPVWFGTQMLPRILGEKRAREVVFLCEQYSAEQALSWGLVNQVHPPENLKEETRKTCQKILVMSPQSIRIAKISFNFGTDAMGPSFTHALEMLASCYGGPELLEGMNAFREKRQPDFSKFRKN